MFSLFLALAGGWTNARIKKLSYLCMVCIPLEILMHFAASLASLNFTKAVPLK